MSHREYRECNECHKLAIPASSQHWIKLCTSCYALSMRNPKYRACVVCKEMNVRKESPSYMTKCSRCYDESMTKCDECGGRLRHGERKVCGECVLLGTKHMLRCEECGILNINYMSCTSMTVCNRCTDRVPKRQCTKCREYVIPETAESWMKTCKGCWMASRR